MIRRIYVMMAAGALIVLLSCPLFSASENKAAAVSAAPGGAPAVKTALAESRPPQKMPTLPINMPKFAIVLGSVTKIDAKDPENAKLEVKSAADNKVYTVEVTPRTNILKATDISELKVGETIRIMARVGEDKHIATSIVFGKIKSPAPYKPATQAPATTKPAAAPKKDTKK